MSNETALVPIQVHSVDFYGDEITAVLLEIDGQQQVYIPIRQFCEYLGLDWSGQRQRMLRDDILSEEMTSVVITPTLIPDQEYKQRYTVICLPLEVLPGWLFGISSSRVRPEFQEKTKRYRRECYRVLWQAFQNNELAVVQASTTLPQIIPSENPQIAALTEQIDTLAAIITFLREHRQALLGEDTLRTVVEANQNAILERTDHISAQLAQVIRLLEGLVGRQEVTETQVARIDERTKRLTPAHAREVQLLVEQVARTIERHSPTTTLSLAHAMIYGRLKHAFVLGVTKKYQTSDSTKS